MNRSTESLEQIFETIKDIHEKAPSLRFGQILKDAIDGDKDLYYYENDEILKYLKCFQQWVKNK